jgi:hypothetical protein
MSHMSTIGRWDLEPKAQTDPEGNAGGLFQITHVDDLRFQKAGEFEKIRLKHMSPVVK